MTDFSMKFVPDTPIDHIDDDQLGFSTFCDLIQRSIYGTQPPFVYGVLGDWGVGKTSILQMLKSSIQEQPIYGNKIYVPIWFNAWKYENEANLIYPLLYTIQLDFEAWMKDFWVREDENADPTSIDLDRVRALVREITKASASWLGNFAMKVMLDKAFGEGKTVAEIYDELEDQMYGWIDPVRRLDKNFHDLLTTYAEAIHFHSPEEVQFVIFIDDLDRCLPDTTIAILESIKNHLAVENTIFVLGLNPHIVSLGIRHKYGNLDINGREYLEKILNYTFYVPEPEDVRVEEFAKLNLAKLVTNIGKQREFHEALGVFPRIVRGAHFSNPRKIKRILNRYLLYLSKYQVDHYQQSELDMMVVVKLIILAEYFPEVFRHYLYDTRETMKQYAKIDDSDFLQRLRDPQKASIIAIHHQLMQMKSLLKLSSLEVDRVQQHAQAVFSITRLT